MAELAGKKALITGAGTGIGRGIALELGARGAAVVFHYHSSEAGAQSAVAEIEAAGGTAAAMQADLSQVSECQRLVQEASNLLGGLDILVNNSGISPEAPFFEVTPEMWDSVHHTNLRSAFFCAQTAAREMLAQGGGKIVHIGSVHGGMSMPRIWRLCRVQGRRPRHDPADGDRPDPVPHQRQLCRPRPGRGRALLSAVSRL